MCDTGGWLQLETGVCQCLGGSCEETMLGVGRRLWVLFSSLRVDPGAKPLHTPALGLVLPTVSGYRSSNFVSFFRIL